MPPQKPHHSILLCLLCVIFILFIFCPFLMRKVEILSICTAKYVIMSPLAFVSALSDGKKDDL